MTVRALGYNVDGPMYCICVFHLVSLASTLSPRVDRLAERLFCSSLHTTLPTGQTLFRLRSNT